MKSRVSKYADLHQKIASDAESTVENSDLSHFANRLNEIDDQFERVNTGSQEIILPNRARNNDNQEKVDPRVDTFETDYLKGFLDEVKEYNVKKGYRDISDTQANILDDLRTELSGKAQEEKKKIQDEFAQTQSIYSEKELAQIADELMKEEEKTDDLEISSPKTAEKIDLNDTLVFGQEISIQSKDSEAIEKVDEKKVLKQKDPSNLVLNESNQKKKQDSEENISDAIQSMSYDDEAEEFEEEFSLRSTDDKREVDLLEQTLSLQHKVFDLENNIEEMSATTSKTNQLLHVVLSLLLFAIIVVALLIVAQLI